MNYEFHPLANLFPLIDGQAYQDLLADVVTHGVREPIWLYEGQILDGRNRYRAAQAMSVPLQVRQYEGNDAVGFVISLNLHRRHLSESQRAAVAAKLANLSNGQKTSSANLQSTPVSQSDAADLLNVSTRSVAAAAKVRDESPEIFKAVESGALSVSLAAQVAAMPAESIQAVAEVFQANPGEAKEVAREIVRAHVANNSGNNEWYTPADYIELAREVMGGIDTDPASSDIANQTVQAAQIYTAEENGLTQTWAGRVWMNPPYAQPLISEFADAVASKYEAGEIEQACVLVNNGTETAWFQRILQSASAVCFPRSRIRFVDPEGKPSGAPLQGQAVLYLGKNPDTFADVFSAKGTVLFNG